MASYKESIIIPYSMFKSCTFKDDSIHSISDQDPYFIRRQSELMQERMFNKKPYPVYTSYIPTGRSELQTELAPAAFDIPVEKDSDSSDLSSDLSISNVLKKISLSQRPNIRSVLEKFKSNSGSWNAGGELIINGHVLPGTNIFKIMQFFSKTKTFKVEPKGVIDIWNFFQDIKIPKSWIKQKPDYIKKTIRTDEVTPSKYPLEEAERDQIAQILKKSKVPGSESPLDVDVESESDKLDYAGAIGTDEDSMFKTPFQTPLALKGAYERNVDIGEIKEPDVPIRFGYSPELEDKSSKVQPDIFQGDSVVKSKSKGKKRLKLKQDEKKRPTHSRAGREYKQTQKMKGEGLRKWTPKLWRL